MTKRGQEKMWGKQASQAWLQGYKKEDQAPHINLQEKEKAASGSQDKPKLWETPI